MFFDHNNIAFVFEATENVSYLKENTLTFTNN